MSGEAGFSDSEEYGYHLSSSCQEQCLLRWYASSQKFCEEINRLKRILTLCYLCIFALCLFSVVILCVLCSLDLALHYSILVRVCLFSVCAVKICLAVLMHVPLSGFVNGR